MTKIRRYAVHWFDPNPAIGSELAKIRPCVVVSPDEMNDLLRTVIIVPLTSTIIPWPFRITIPILNRKASAACDQIRAVDKSRLKSHMFDLERESIVKLHSALQALMAEQ